MDIIELPEKLTSLDDAKQFLRDRGLSVKERVVREVVATIRGETRRSRYDLWKQGEYRNGRPRTPICSKGTVDKIWNFYRQGMLQPYLDWIHSPVQGSSHDEAVPSFGHWVEVVPDDSWRWWPVETVRRCPYCRCLNLRSATECQKCAAGLNVGPVQCIST